MEPYLKPNIEVIELDGNDTLVTSGTGGNGLCCKGADLAANLYVIELPDLP